MSPAPRVTVCVPVHNGARYIRETLESVLAQEHTDYELLICDDGSTDETPGLCRGYRDPRIRYRRFTDRGGQAVNFNRCLAEARGDLVTFLHADDLYRPGLLARRVAQLAQETEAGFACGAVQMIDAEGKAISLSRPWPEARSFASGGLLAPLLHGCVVSSLGLVVRRERLVPFRTDLTWGHDWDWEMRLARDNGAHYDPEALACYRVHEESGTAQILRMAENGAQERRILRDALAGLPPGFPGRRRLERSTFRALARRHMYFAELAVLAGRWGACRYNLRYAAWADASMAVRPTFWALLWTATTGAVGFYRSFQRRRGREPATPVT